MTHAITTTLPANERVGLLAGWGRYPLLVVEAMRQQGCEIYCLGVKGHADPQLIDLCDGFRWVGIASIGSAIRFLKQHDVRRATMAGKLHKIQLFRPWVWWEHFPDWRSVKAFYPHFVLSREDRKDDTLLSVVADEFGRDGIRFVPATDIAPELLVRSGTLSRRSPSGVERKDIAFGWEIAKEMGRLDIGQSVMVKNRAALAIEAIEGTDDCIRRAGQLCGVGGFTVVKVAKPQQDMRFDVPTIGVGTLETMVEAGAKVLAIEAGRTIILDEPEVIRFANRHRLVIVSLNAAEAQNAIGEPVAA